MFTGEIRSRLSLLLCPALPLLLAACDGAVPAASATESESASAVDRTAARAVDPDHDRDLVPPANIPTALKVPARQALKLVRNGVGVQIYTCAATVTATGTTYAFTFVAPEADLLDEQGFFKGNHFLGPTWQYHDGSKIAGTTVAKVASPDPDAIPWLLLSAKSTDGPGRLADVTYVQRINTSGGDAPATGCDSTSVGTEVRVPYSADYLFYHPGR